MSGASLRSGIYQKVAELAGVEPDAIDEQTTLESLGLDSSDAVVLAMEAEKVAQREIEVAIFLRNETIAMAAAEIERICRSSA